jgi:hypothetical protein
LLNDFSINKAPPTNTLLRREREKHGRLKIKPALNPTGLQKINFAQMPRLNPSLIMLRINWVQKMKPNPGN